MPSISESEQKLGQTLVAHGHLTQKQLEFALGEKRKRGQGKPLGSLLVELGYLKEEKVVGALGELYNMPVMSADEISPSTEVLQFIPEEMIRKYKIFPVFEVGEELTVALADPSEFFVLEMLRERTHRIIQPVIISNSDLVRLIGRYFSRAGGDGKAEALELQQLGYQEEGAEDVRQLEKAGRELPVVEIVDKLFSQAVREGASDIHLEPTTDKLRVRFRIDGVLFEKMSLARHFQSGIVSRVKILSNLNIAERHVPQDGRIQLSIQDREIDLRVSTLPTYFGEKVVLRILDRARSVLPLEQLGLSTRNLEIFRGLVSEPYGVILVTGPTGSGKTTTLYSALGTVDAVKLNIITVEDPVEYQIPNISQVPINPKRGLTFALALRAILRQDPDVILVGEIRDPETGNIAAEAALTGHLVFSTLHTNDAVSSFNRLVEIGVEPYLISPSLQGVVAQRLVRTICPKCKEAYYPSPQELNDLKLGGIQKEVKFYRGKGCEDCFFRGYRGRMGIHEILVVDEGIREMISNRVTTTVLRNHLQASGFRDMRFDGLKKIAAGMTTAEEVLRVTRDVK